MEERNIDRINDILEKAKSQGWLDGFDFSILMQRLLIPDGGYIIDTGNWENVNAEAALMLYEKIKRHPILWRLFFMLREGMTGSEGIENTKVYLRVDGAYRTLFLQSCRAQPEGG